MLKVRLLALLAALAAAIAMTTGCFGTGKPRPASIEEPTFEPDTSGNVAYMQAVPSTTRLVHSTSYEVGQRRSAAVGAPMLGVRNYTAATRVVTAMAARPFRQLCSQPEVGEPVADKHECRSGRLAWLRGNEGERFDVAGAITEAGAIYYMVRLPASGGAIYLAVDTQGRIKPGRYAAWSASDPATTPIGIPLRWQDTPVDFARDAALFRFETAESIATGLGNLVHYEVIYRGVTMNYRGLAFHLLYREYRSDAADVPIFEQDLEFAADVSFIDVLGLRLRVHDVNESEISYTVVSD